MKKFELHIDINDESLTLIDHLKNACTLSNAELKQAIDKGALWHSKNKHTQRLRRIKKPLKTGEQLHFYYDEKVLNQSPSPAILVHDSTNYSIWFKPYGMLSQGSKWSDHCTIARWAEKTLQRASFIVHRLDRAASGLIIIAHTKQTARYFGQLFETHDLDKHYQILVHGNFGTNPSPVIETSSVDEKSAKSTFTFNDYDANINMSLVDVDIASGRKHQIRLHSAKLGFPVVGDRLHGDQSRDYNEQLHLQLCAVKLAFTCPNEQSNVHFLLPDELRPNFERIYPFI